MTKLIEGFDYRTDRPVSMTRKEWRALVRAYIAKGGRRKIVEGETFLIPRVGQIEVEIYANIPE